MTGLFRRPFSSSRTTRRSLSIFSAANSELTIWSAMTSIARSRSSIGVTTWKLIDSQPVQALVQPPRASISRSRSAESGRRGRALEVHVLHEVGRADRLAPLVARAAARRHADRDDVRAGPLADDRPHPVGQDGAEDVRLLPPIRAAEVTLPPTSVPMTRPVATRALAVRRRCRAARPFTARSSSESSESAGPSVAAGAGLAGDDHAEPRGIEVLAGRRAGRRRRSRRGSGPPGSRAAACRRRCRGPCRAPRWRWSRRRSIRDADLAADGVLKLDRVDRLLADPLQLGLQQVEDGVGGARRWCRRRRRRCRRRRTARSTSRRCRRARAGRGSR